MRIPLAALTLVLTMASCNTAGDETGGDGTGWNGETRDSAGVLFVSNPASGSWNDQTRWTIERDLVIGADHQNVEEYEFGSIADVAVGRDGRMYVLDNQNARVSVFEPDGTYAFAFGRLGEGPGEFSIEAFALRIHSDGTVAVRDGINNRDNLFDRNGSFLRVERVPPSSEESASLPQDGRVERIRTSDWDGLVLVASGGAIQDTIIAFQYDMTRRGGALSSAARAETGSRIEIPLLPPDAFWGVTSDGRVVTGVSNEYRVEVRRPTGELEMVLEKEHPSLAMSSEDDDRLQLRVRSLLREAGLSEDAIAGVFQRFAYTPPDSLPAFTSIVGGPAETIWVQRLLPIDSMTANTTLDALNAGSAQWDVFCGSGRYLGDVSFPPRFALITFEGSHGYGVETDDLDVQRVVRYRIDFEAWTAGGRTGCRGAG